MAQYMRLMGRLAGRAIRTQIVDQALRRASSYITSEIRLADIRMRLKILKQKRTRHLTILGRTVYRLTVNEVDTKRNDRIETLIRVLSEIDSEIEATEATLSQRVEYEKQQRTSSRGTV